MRILNFILGLMFFIASSIVILSFVTDMYSNVGYDIDLDNDTYTGFLSKLQTEVNEAKVNTTATSNSIYSNVPGQPNSSFKSGEVSEGDMISSSISALSNIGRYFDVFTGMMSAMFNAIGLETTSPIFWFFITGLTITIGLLLITSVLRNII